jgi:TolB-like protein/DNA-binding SARP family transcriptional activator
VLRDALGEDSILATGDVLSLNTDRITCDVTEFESAIERGEGVRAASLYETGGAFLDGVHLSDAGEFERWTESVRDRLATSYRETLESLANEVAALGDLGGAVRWWRKLAAEDRLSSRVALCLMRALAAAGDRAGALEFARVHESVVRSELDSEPDAAVAAFTAELRALRASAPVATADEPAASQPAPPSPVSDDDSGARVDQPVTAVSTGTSARRPWSVASRARWLGALILVVPLTVYVAQRARPPAVDRAGVLPARHNPSIAILPLTNVSGDPTNESFVDGMTEELTTALSSIDGLDVAANTWAMAFKGIRTDVRRIADSLHVTHLLEGDLQLSNGRIRMNVRLVDAASGSTRWSAKYDDTLTDAFAIQDSIGRAVARALELRLVSGGNGHVARHMTSDPVAYDLYIRGRDPTLLRSDSGVLAAADFFSRAIARDSTFAAAYAGLAHTYATLVRGGGPRPRPVLIDSADKAALKAVSLDDSLAEGHTFLAFAKLTRQDFRGTSNEVNRALELDPSDLFARTVLAVLYNWSGRHEDAVTENRRIVAADPSPLHRMDLAQALFFAGHDDEALAELQPLREVHPPLRRTPQLAGEIYLHKQMWPQALDELRHSINPGAPARAMLGLALGKSGDRSGAMAILQELKERQRAETAGAFQVAVVYFGLGDYDQAFVWLDKAVDDHSVNFMIVDPTFAQLRGDPRFARLRRRLGIDDLQLK